MDLFGNMETLYNFICGSKKQNAFYEKVQNEYSTGQRVRRLKRISTRWSSQDIQTILETFDAVIGYTGIFKEPRRPRWSYRWLSINLPIV